MKKLSFAFRRFSDAELEVFAQAVATSMTGNSYFPASMPTLTAMVTATTVFSEALSRAKSGNKTDIVLKSQKRQELLDALTVLALEVMLIAAGNEAILVSSGFHLQKTREPQPPITSVGIRSVTDGPAPGQLKVHLNKVGSAVMYEYHYTPDPITPNSEWKRQTSTLVRFTITDLESGKRYWIRAAALGREEQVVFSDPVSRIVQ